MDTNELKTYGQNETDTSVTAQVNNTEDKGTDHSETVTTSSLKNLRRRLSKGTKKMFKVRWNSENSSLEITNRALLSRNALHEM